MPFDRPAFPLALPPGAKSADREGCTERAYEGTRAPASGGVAFSARTVQRVYRSDVKVRREGHGPQHRSAGGAPALKRLPAAPQRSRGDRGPERRNGRAALGGPDSVADLQRIGHEAVLAGQFQACGNGRLR